MSKTNNEEQPVTETDPVTPNGNGQPGEGSGSVAPNGTPAKKPDLPTIEEHSQNLGVDAPVFAAVMQAEGWAAGKRVTEAVFKEAVKSFLGAPMGGK